MRWAVPAKGSSALVPEAVPRAALPEYGVCAVVVDEGLSSAST